MYYCINKWHGAQAPTRVDGDGDGGDDGNGGGGGDGGGDGDVDGVGGKAYFLGQHCTQRQ